MSDENKSGVAELEQKILDQSLKEYEAALKYRNPRIKTSWHLNEDMYFGRKGRKLRGRHNLKFGDMQGFIDTYLSKIKDAPNLNFDPTSEADTRRAAKVTKVWEQEARPNRGDWGFIDLLGKKKAGIYGRCIAKYFAESEPEYSSNLVLVDPYDFLIDPMAGGLDTEHALFMGHDNIFKTFYELENDERYDEAKLNEAKNAIGRDATQDDDNDENEKSNRTDVFGYNARLYKTQSEETLKLTEWYTTYKGTRYLCVFDARSKVWLRVQELKEIFTTEEYENGDPLWPMDSWATHPDAFEFWTPSPADQVREGYIAEEIMINQAFDNRQYRNFGMKLYDSKRIKNPALLEPRWSGLIPVTDKEGKGVASALHQITYPVLGDTQTLHQLIDGKLSKNSGIGASIQGASEKDKKVGVFEGEIAQAADRLALYEKSYGRFWLKMGKRYLNGLKEHMPQDIAVKIMGVKGLEWEKLVKDELDTKFDINVSGMTAEVEADARARRDKFTVLDGAVGSQDINQAVLHEERFTVAGIDKELIKRLLDTENEGDRQIMLEAAEENEYMLKEEVEANEGSTTGHIKKHLDFVRDNQELDDEIKDRILAHANAEVEFARKNMIKKARQIQAEQGIPLTPAGGGDPSLPAPTREPNLPNVQRV